MITAETVPTGAACVVPTGKNAKISRRGALALAGVAAAGAAAAVTVLPAGAAVPVHAAMDAGGPDAAFWLAHARYQALLAAWDADEDDSDETWNRYAAQVREAEAGLLLMKPHTGAVVLAKLRIARKHEVDSNLPGKSFTALDVVEWDIERLSKKQWWFA